MKLTAEEKQAIAALKKIGEKVAKKLVALFCIGNTLCHEES